MSEILAFMQKNGRSLKSTFGSTVLFPNVLCKDGASFSIQASENHLCYPEETLGGIRILDYEALEVYTHGRAEELLEEFTTGHGICGRVPVELIDEILKSHGGIV